MEAKFKCCLFSRRNLLILELLPNEVKITLLHYVPEICTYRITSQRLHLTRGCGLAEDPEQDLIAGTPSDEGPWLQAAARTARIRAEPSVETGPADAPVEIDDAGHPSPLQSRFAASLLALVELVALVLRACGVTCAG